ncbi:hypothetical protein Trco_001228 [Trichoderma cornu-damae]|uniref:Uncharacterized protein n=1 Tax=Trichoderma cornu-damae TaxID=654480 RepID=A0A9P8QXK0_9HYPO|nr:hypothetical protein Trco_001228 [Trichoderma cornu-damae]
MPHHGRRQMRGPASIVCGASLGARKLQRSGPANRCGRPPVIGRRRRGAPRQAKFVPLSGLCSAIRGAFSGAFSGAISSAISSAVSSAISRPVPAPAPASARYNHAIEPTSQLAKAPKHPRQKALQNTRAQHLCRAAFWSKSLTGLPAFQLHRIQSLPRDTDGQILVVDKASSGRSALNCDEG